VLYASASQRKLTKLSQLVDLAHIFKHLHQTRKLQRLKARKRCRGPQPPRTPPLTWAEFRAKPMLRRKGFFERLFRMTEGEFQGVATLLAAHEAREHAARAHRGGAPRCVEVKCRLAMTLRYLAGGAECDQCLIWNVMPSTFKRVRKETLEALYDVLPDLPLPRLLDDAVAGNERPLRDIEHASHRRRGRPLPLRGGRPAARCGARLVRLVGGEPSRPTTPNHNSPGVHVTVMVCLKLHNLSIKTGSSLAGHLAIRSTRTLPSARPAARGGWTRRR